MDLKEKAGDLARVFLHHVEKIVFNPIELMKTTNLHINDFQYITAALPNMLPYSLKKNSSLNFALPELKF